MGVQVLFSSKVVLLNLISYNYLNMYLIRFWLYMCMYIKNKLINVYEYFSNV